MLPHWTDPIPVILSSLNFGIVLGMRLSLLLITAGCLAAQTNDSPARAVTDPGVVTTRQAITPAGVPAIFQGRVYGVDFGATESEIWVQTATHIWRLDWRQNKVLDRFAHEGRAGIASLRFHAASSRALAASVTKDNEVRFSAAAPGSHEVTQKEAGKFLAGAMAIAGNTAALPLIYDNKLAVFDAASGKLTASIKTEIAPFGAALSADGKTAWVSNWGGRVPKPADLTAPTGYKPGADHVVVTPKGSAASGTLVRIDLEKQAVTDSVAVNPHPMALAWDTARNRLYVASGNHDTVQVIDTATKRLLATHRLRWLSDGAVIGSKAFVQEMRAHWREKLGYKRAKGAYEAEEDPEFCMLRPLRGE